MRICFGVALLSATLVYAQVIPQQAFPERSTPVTGDLIKERLAGKVFSVKPADGSTWRLEFKTSGDLFLDTDRGYRDYGTWRVEGNNWCADLRKTGVSCSELRQLEEVLYYKRASNGEVVAMTLR
jgi:hypothetical protein